MSVSRDPVGDRRIGESPGVSDSVIVHLHAGQLFASAAPCTISIILGSCVGVCLADPVRRFGGANHYLLPLHAVGGASARFGNVAIDELVARMMELGSQKGDLVAKVFGGADTMPAQLRGRADCLGMRNVEVARVALADHHIPIVAEDVGGERGRKVLFQTREGDAYVRKL